MLWIFSNGLSLSHLTKWLFNLSFARVQLRDDCKLHSFALGFDLHDCRGRLLGVGDGGAQFIASDGRRR